MFKELWIKFENPRAVEISFFIVSFSVLLFSGRSFGRAPSCKNASHCSSPPPAREGKSFDAGSEKKCKNCSTFDHITPESAALIFFSCSSSFACSLSRFPYLCRRAVAKKKLNVRNAENLVGICLGRRPSGQLALPSFRFRKFQDEITKYV